jgi:hypothetical protein
MERGFRTGAPEHVGVPRARAARLLEELPRGLRTLEPTEAYPVSRSAALEALADSTAAALKD